MHQEAKSSGRATRRRLSEEERDKFLEVLGQTGNRSAAAQAIGADPRCMDQRREFDPVLDRLWDAAIEQADRRLAGASGPFDCVGAREFNVIKRGPSGRLQLARSGPKRWNCGVEDRFFATLAMCGNIAAAARAIGFSTSSVAQRRQKWPAFAQRFDEALEDAELQIEFRLAAVANDIGARIDGSAIPAGEAQAAPQRFDPDFALRFLRWREEKRRSQARSGAAAPEFHEPPIEEVRARILTKLDAIERHGQAERIKQGWSRDEEGRMIPPGWVRAEAGSGDGEGKRPTEGEA